MALRVAFSEADITPSIGTQLAGWLDLARPAERVRDPVFARLMLIESGGVRVGVVSLDLLSIRGSDVIDIRQRVERAAGVPTGNLMVAATHNHAGPAIVSIGPFRRDDTYLERLKETLVSLAVEATASLESAELGIGVGFEGRISFNRRWITKSGIVRTQPGVANPQVLACEGPIDPQICLLHARRPSGETLGFAYNWSCHPVHPYDMRTVSASWPGALAREIRDRHGAPCLVLNGAFGNVHSANWVDPDYRDDPDRMGTVLANDLEPIMGRMSYVQEARLDARSATAKLPLRAIPQAEIDDAKRVVAGEDVLLPPGVQRYGANRTYAESLLGLVERKKERDFSRAEVQAIRIGSTALVGLPAEAFVESGLRIKLESPFDPTFVVGAANGMIGYAPPPANYARGGYECTTAHWSKVAPEAADLMVDAARELTRGLYA